MKLSQFKFKLPEDKIALYPPLHRDEARMMVLHRKTGKIEHKIFLISRASGTAAALLMARNSEALGQPIWLPACGHTFHHILKSPLRFPEGQLGLGYGG